MTHTPGIDGRCHSNSSEQRDGGVAGRGGAGRGEEGEGTGGQAFVVCKSTYQTQALDLWLVYAVPVPWVSQTNG